VLAVAVVLAVRSEPLPSWVPDEIGSLTIHAGDASELGVTREDADAYTRSRLFVADPAAPPEPDAFPVRVTGRVAPRQPTKPMSIGAIVLRDVDRKPAWLVAWRSLDRSYLASQSLPSEVDVVCFVDGETEAFLVACTFTSLGV
jgi:hypothetical protein